MNPQADRFVVIRLCFLVVLGVTAAAPVIAEAKEPKYTIKEVMQAIHKGQDNIGKRAAQGAASKDEIARIAEYYESLPQNEPPRGELASWKEKTGKLLSAAGALKAGTPGAVEMYKAATNCKACHNEHKPEDKK